MSRIPLNLTAAKPADAPTSLRKAWIAVGYYLAVLLPAVTYAVIGHTRFSISGTLPAPIFETGLAFTNLIWVVQLLILILPLITSLAGVTGLVAFGAPRDKRPDADWRWDPTVKLLVSYVSRGNQPHTLKQAMTQTQSVLNEYDVAYAIEVVTDIDVAEDNRVTTRGGEVLYYVVPADYQTPHGARYKARALQYLLEQRTTRLNGREDADNVWILHMDEESVLTPECIWGIQKHIEKYDLRQTTGAIGQGEILYNSVDYGSHMLTAAIDASRTGGDLGHFRTQYKAFHRPLIGMHGSFVLTPASIERTITWDVGGHGSITEDSYFALMASERGIRFDWVEGFIREQSPFTVMDIIRQRRRWHCGLLHVSCDPKLRFLTTFTLWLHVRFAVITALALPLPLFYLQQRFMFGKVYLPYWVFLYASICTGLYGAAYLVGAYRNVIHCNIPLLKKISIVAFAMLCWFFFIPAFVECAGILYAFFFPVSTFYIVKKDLTPDATILEAS